MFSATDVIIFLNKFFPKSEHPFNLQNEGKMTYAQWEYTHGANAIACFADCCTPEAMFKDKNVLDMGCGAGGKSMYFVSVGAKHVTGVDIVESYAEESRVFAEELVYEDRFTFVCASAFELPFEDNSFDTIIMNDFFEHVSDPAGALREALRVLTSGGRIYMNFPPYYHPQGAHMTDVISIPWVQLFFTEKQLIAAYKHLVKGLPDEEMRLSFRFSKDENGVERYTYINHMTLSRAKKIIKEVGVKPEFYEEIPLKKSYPFLAKIPVLKEMFVYFGVYVIRKPR